MCIIHGKPISILRSDLNVVQLFSDWKSRSWPRSVQFSDTFQDKDKGHPKTHTKLHGQQHNN